MDIHQEVVLLTPGPTPIHPRALAAFHWPMRSHMDPEVFAFNDRIVSDLHILYGTDGKGFACLLSGTGSMGMEAGFANLLEPGDEALIVSNGVFGERMIEMAGRLGAKVHPLRFGTGQVVDVDRVRKVAHRVKPKLMALVHGETSTGVINPAQAIGEVAREVDALYSVDAVTTVGMDVFEMAAWGIDYAYTGSQKCLSAPPGVAPVAFSERAIATIQQRKTAVSTWYSDVLGMRQYWQPGERAYHHTVPIQLHWATGEAIRAALDEGLVNRASRVKWIGEAILASLETVGFKAFVPAEQRLPTVLAVTLPEGLEDAKVRHALRHDYRISITGGLGETQGKIWRLGLMGENARPGHYLRFMRALGELLQEPDLPGRFEEAVAIVK